MKKVAKMARRRKKVVNILAVGVQEMECRILWMTVEVFPNE